MDYKVCKVHKVCKVPKLAVRHWPFAIGRKRSDEAKRKAKGEPRIPPLPETPVLK